MLPVCGGVPVLSLCSPLFAISCFLLWAEEAHVSICVSPKWTDALRTQTSLLLCSNICTNVQFKTSKATRNLLPSLSLGTPSIPRPVYTSLTPSPGAGTQWQYKLFDHVFWHEIYRTQHKNISCAPQFQINVCLKSGYVKTQIHLVRLSAGS